MFYTGFYLGCFIGALIMFLIEKSRSRKRSAVNVDKGKPVYAKIIHEIGNLWLNEAMKNILEDLTVSNFDSQSKKIDKVVKKLTDCNVVVGPDGVKTLHDHLKEKFEQVKANQKAKDEQSRIKELMREEKAAEKVRVGELKAIEKETKLILKRKGEMEEKIKLLHELDSLKKISAEQLKELHELSEMNKDLEQELISRERAKSMAEMTKAGNVYVISNIGSFGENVFKVGMTRRLIPEDRIKELSDASVPFPFDIHFMISSEDAPKLESLLHEKIWDYRYNFVNDRKEFFKVELAMIKKVIEESCEKGTYQFFEADLASEWHESNSLKESKQNSKYDRSVEALEDEEDEAA